MTSLLTGVKAQLLCVDHNLEFSFQFNPSKLSLGRSVNWNGAAPARKKGTTKDDEASEDDDNSDDNDGELGSAWPALTSAKGDLDELEFETLFDESEDHEMAQLSAPVESTRTVALSGFSPGEVVLANADGSAFAVMQTPRQGDGEGGAERGLVVVFSAAPELAWTNLPVKPLMVPLFQEIMRAGIQLAAGRSEVVVGERLRADPQAAFRSERGGSIAIGADGSSAAIVEQSGLWRSDAGAIVAANLRPSSLMLAPNASDAVRGALAPLGDVRFRSADEAGEVRIASTRGSWSFALLVAALAILLAEGVLSRIFSHASLRRADSAAPSIATVGRVRQPQRQRPEPVGSGGRA